MAEHKVLLDRILSQNAVVTNMMSIFPIKSVESLKELDALLATQSDPYVSIQLCYKTMINKHPKISRLYFKDTTNQDSSWWKC